MTQVYLAPAAGSGATFNLYGNDFFGVVELTTGSSPSTGELFRVVMGSLYDARNGYALVPFNAAAEAVTTYIGGGTAGMSIDCSQNTRMIVKTDPSAALSASTTYVWGYVMQNMAAVQ